MKNSGRIFWTMTMLLASMSKLATGSSFQQQEPVRDLSWAYAVTDKNLPATNEDTQPQHIPGSSKAFAFSQIDDLLNPPDWFPDEHPIAPNVIIHGQGP